MTDQRLYVAVGVPMLFNAVFVGLSMAYVNARIGGLRAEIMAEIRAVDTKITALNQRFDDLRDMWRAELYRFGGVLDARLKHLEQERH